MPCLRGDLRIGLLQLRTQTGQHGRVTAGGSRSDSLFLVFLGLGLVGGFLMSQGQSSGGSGSEQGRRDGMRSRTCPDRWRAPHANTWARPPRPQVCPCCWSGKLTVEHWAEIMRGLDDDTLVTLGALGKLFVQ